MFCANTSLTIGHMRWVAHVVSSDCIMRVLNNNGSIAPMEMYLWLNNAAIEVVAHILN